MWRADCVDWNEMTVIISLIFNLPKHPRRWWWCWPYSFEHPTIPFMAQWREREERGGQNTIKWKYAANLSINFNFSMSAWCILLLLPCTFTWIYLNVRFCSKNRKIGQKLNLNTFSSDCELWHGNERKKWWTFNSFKFDYGSNLLSDWIMWLLYVITIKMCYNHRILPLIKIAAEKKKKSTISLNLQHYEKACTQLLCGYTSLLSWIEWCG